MKTNTTILIVDDEMLNIELAAVYLKEEGYKVLYALDALSAIQSISKNKVSLILLDINMPNKDGFEVCEILKADKKTRDIPIIFLTAQTDIKYISRAFDVGGVDYISKPFNGVELKVRVRTHLQTLHFIDDIKDKQSKLAQFSITDPLTKLHNSLYFDSQIANYQKKDEKFWIITLKINKLEKINQIYGFYGANKIIKNFAKVIEKESFSNAKIARLYGANFGIILKNYDKKEIRKLYKSIVLTIEKNEQFSNTIKFSTVLFHIKEPKTSLPNLYKKILTNMQTLQENVEFEYLFIE